MRTAPRPEERRGGEVNAVKKKKHREGKGQKQLAWKIKRLSESENKGQGKNSGRGTTEGGNAGSTCRGVFAYWL